MDRAAAAASGQGAATVRLIRAAAAVCVLGGCANIGAPPGGPTRTEPPKLVSVTPDSGAVNVRAEEVTFAFDAVVSDRPSGQASSLEALFIISPRDGTPRVRWERNRIEVRPRRGFQPNTAYSVTMLPGIVDLRGNAVREQRTIVFSTGASIPPYAIRGRVFDWMAERPSTGALVEVTRQPDSVQYVGAVDSTGQFSIGPLNSGTYSVRAILDNNRNRSLDPGEAWDSVAVIVREVSPFIELLAAPRDTAGPRILTADARDSATIVLNFDKPLDPAATLTPASFRVLSADSTRLGIARVLPRRPADPTTPPADSVRRDTTARTDAPRPAIVPKPSVPAPTVYVTLVLDSASTLRPDARYRVTAVNTRGLLGGIRTSDRVITFEPRRDTVTTPRRP